MLETATVQLVDLREDFSYGLVHIDGATHIELAEVYAQKKELLKEHPVVFHCDEGLRSVDVALRFRKGDWKAFYMEGGIRRWIDDGLPVKRTNGHSKSPSNGA